MVNSWLYMYEATLILYYIINKKSYISLESEYILHLDGTVLLQIS